MTSVHMVLHLDTDDDDQMATFHETLTMLELCHTVIFTFYQHDCIEIFTVCLLFLWILCVIM